MRGAPPRQARPRPSGTAPVVRLYAAQVVQFSSALDTLWLYNVNDLDEEAIGDRLSTYALEKTGAELSEDWVLPIILPTGEEYETVLRAVVNTLVDVGRAINPDGP